MWVADLSRDDLRDLITSLNERSESVGCVVMDRGVASAEAIVIFAGHLERFHMLAVARHLTCKVIYFQDVKSGWYQGSDLLPPLQELCRSFLVEELGSARALFFGQSSGAYAALVASTYRLASTVIACAPQTFSDAAIKAKINFIGIRALSAPEGIIDLQNNFRDRSDPEACTTVVIAASELGNPATAHYWMDYLHALRLADLPGVRLTVVNADSHVIVHMRLNRFAELLRDLAPKLAAPVEERNAVIQGFLTETFSV